MMEDSKEDELYLSNADETENDVVLAEYGDNTTCDPDIELLTNRMKEIEEEAALICKMQNEIEKQFAISPNNSMQQLAVPSAADQLEVDSRSIYIGNLQAVVDIPDEHSCFIIGQLPCNCVNSLAAHDVDYSATAEELEVHFHGCGCVNRVTILTDRFTGHPKGFAYMEFADKGSVQTAIALNDTLFHGRQIKVCAKRTNKPGMSTTNRYSRGRGHGKPHVIVKYVYGSASNRGVKSCPPKCHRGSTALST